MRAIVCTGANDLALEERPVPEPGTGQVRVRTAACGICSTDLEVMASGERIGFPAVLGHEWSGVVDGVGDRANEGLLGEACVAENVWSSDGLEVGFEHPGGYAEFFLTEAANVEPIPADFPASTAVLIEPLAVCVRALRRFRLCKPEPILIIGDGPIGLISTMLLSGQGFEEIHLIGGRERRLALARDLGAATTVNYHEAGENLTEAIRETCGDEFPNIIVAAASTGAILSALDLAAQCGKILNVAGHPLMSVDTLWMRVLLQEIELIGSNASAEAWPEAVRLATKTDLPLDRLITHRFPVAQYKEAFDIVRTSPDAVKVVLEWG